MAMTESGGKMRGRRSKASGEDAVLSSLNDMVDELIRENTRLKRELKRLEEGTSGNGAALAGLHRRLTNALGTPKAPVRKPRGKITDPELLQKKREALARARAAQAAKRAALSEDS